MKDGSRASVHEQRAEGSERENRSVFTEGGEGGELEPGGVGSIRHSGCGLLPWWVRTVVSKLPRVRREWGCSLGSKNRELGSRGSNLTRFHHIHHISSTFRF